MAKPTVHSIEELRENLSEITRRVSIAKERVIVTFHGKPLCAVVPVEDLESEQAPAPAQPRIRRTRVRFT